MQMKELFTYIYIKASFTKLSDDFFALKFIS